MVETNEILDDVKKQQENKTSSEKQATTNDKQGIEQDKLVKEATAEKAADKPVLDKNQNAKKKDVDNPAKEVRTANSDKEKKAKPEPQKRNNKPPKKPKEEKAVIAGNGSKNDMSSMGGVTDKKEPTTPKGKKEIPTEPITPEAKAKPEVVNEPQPPEPPKDATRPGEKETIVYIDHSELHPFKEHPFQVRDDDAMKTLVASVKERGVDQPALVRPRAEGGYELVAGHRRQHASELAGLKNVPCVVRNMTDEEAVLAMAESNFNQRSEILPSERAQALKMQLDAIKRQGSRFNGVATGDVGKRSNEIVAERNKMGVKQVQRYISLNKLVPELMKYVDDKKVPFTAAVELSNIKPKNQEYIAVAIDAQQSSPTLAQSQRMRELEAKGMLNGDVIDGIMLEEKKEEIKVILNSQELGKYFGADKTPREMKDIILKLLDEYKEKQPPELTKPDKPKQHEK